MDERSFRLTYASQLKHLFEFSVHLLHAKTNLIYEKTFLFRFTFYRTFLLNSHFFQLQFQFQHPYFIIL